MNLLEQVKLASFLSDKPKGVKDYARIGGRSALEGGLGVPAGLLSGVLASIGLLKFPGLRRALIQGHRSRYGIPAGKRIFLDLDAGMGASLGAMGGVAGGLFGLGHGAYAANQNANERNRSGLSKLLKRSTLEQVKLASFLSDEPGISDYARVGGRTALEGSLGGYGAGALTSLLMGLVAKRFPGAVGSGLARGLVGGMTGLGAAAGGMHGYGSAMANARQRLGPIGKIKRLLGLQS